MTLSEVEIAYLADHSDLTEQLARISWNEWRSIYEQRGETFDDALRKHRERINIDCLELALVALADAELVGTASLKHNDLIFDRGLTRGWGECLSFQNGEIAVWRHFWCVAPSKRLSD